MRGETTTNGIESVFAVLKRGLIGVYHHASPKHLDRYVDEFAFRLNEGNVKNHTLTRLDSFVDGTAGKRLTTFLRALVVGLPFKGTGAKVSGRTCPGRPRTHDVKTQGPRAAGVIRFTSRWQLVDGQDQAGQDGTASERCEIAAEAAGVT